MMKKVKGEQIWKVIGVLMLTTLIGYGVRVLAAMAGRAVLSRYGVLASLGIGIVFTAIYYAVLTMGAVWCVYILGVFKRRS